MTAVMFRKGRARKAPVNLSKRKWKTSCPSHKDWDSTVTDLSVHKASEEEVQRRRLIHRSKNASAARRALGERAKRVFMDPASPAQVEMEMKKLAILKEVLYDHDDLNEVLKRVDNTMHSVQTMFHGAPFRTAGNPNVTLAPGARSSVNGPVYARDEPTTQLSLLSDSVMDKHALNEESSSSDVGEDEEKFESKIDYERFLNVLKDSMSKTAEPPTTGDAADTPVNNVKSGLQQNQALNRTEEVKRTMARVESQTQDAENLKTDLKCSQKKIDGTISNLCGGMKMKSQTVSFSAGETSAIPPPRANMSSANMTYENLQDAIESVANNLSELENRRGNEGLCQSINTSLKSDGLAGFTATLIDAVTRLTVYVNEAEGKLLVVESKMADLKDQNDHQRALLDALTAELMSTQEQNAKTKETTEQMRKSHDEFKISIQQEVDELKQHVKQLQNDKSENKHGASSLAAGPSMVDEIFATQQNKKVCDTEKDEQEEALKSDMLSLLGALKSQKPKDESIKHESSGNIIPMNNDTTRNAAQTVASVESQLRHLQLQHAEAQNRLHEFTLVAGELARKGAASQSPISQAESIASPASLATPSIISGPLTPLQENYEFHDLIPSQQHDDDSISTMTITSSLLPNIDTSRPSMQSNEAPLSTQNVPALPRKVEDLSSLQSSDRVCLSEDSFYELQPEKIPTLLLRQTNIDRVSQNTNGDNLSLLEESINQALTALPSFKPVGLGQPKCTRTQKTENLTTSIKETQFNLEDRIADLNRQHSEAQARLQSLLKKRATDVSSSTTSSQSSGGSTSKVIQVTLPTEDMLKTPQVHKPAQPFRPVPFGGISGI